MRLFNCNCKCSCVIAAAIVSAIIGVVTAFLQITAVITVTPVFLWVVFGTAVVYLGILIAAAQARVGQQCGGMCCARNTSIIGILGTILFALVLLAVGITATSVVSAILVGLLLFSFALMLTASACYARCPADREE